METMKTDRPLFKNRGKITRDIAIFWNHLSEGFREVWGPHIHHGYFEHSSELPLAAQEKLIEKLIHLLTISPQNKILDVGCGMGGSSLYLAKKFNAQITGISLSQRQVDMATEAAKQEKLRGLTFKVEDALSLASFPDNEFDVVWSLESCEQFYDKELFIQQAFRVLKPGGDLMLATWCSGAEEYEGLEAKKYQKLCTAFQLPYMPTINRYVQILQRCGFAVMQNLNWSSQVKKSWDMGLTRLNAYSLVKIFKISGWRGVLFARNAKLMKYGFEDGMIEYGVLVARKPRVND
jgi:tocopherol O-methyltransferase